MTTLAIIRPVDRAAGIFRVAICCEEDGSRTWHRYRGTLAGAVAFCKRHGREYSIVD